MARRTASPWTVYLLRCGDGSLYTGIARDVAHRLRRHNEGRGAAYTRARQPVTLVYQEKARDRPGALRREWAIKQLTRAEKEQLLMRTRDDGGRATDDRRQATGDRRRVTGVDTRGTWNAERFSAFRPAALGFFAQLKRRNTKAWFAANREVYEAEVRGPLKALVEEIDVRLARFAPEIVGDPRRSIFRIHRDVRFSQDKSPYKTHAACWFYHQDAGRGVGSEATGGAGFYFHFSPTEVLMGAGIWMPPRSALCRLRDALADDQKRFEAIVLDPAFRRRFGALDEEAMLKRLPRGFTAGHPAARWLRYQSFTAGRSLARRDLLSPRLPELLAKDYEALTPLVRWLNAALGFRTLKRRV